MPLPPKPLLSEIVAEFGADGTPLLSDYVRGGALVPPGNPGNANIAIAAKDLLLSQFAGAQKEVVIAIGNGWENINLRSVYDASKGAPSQAVRVRFTIAANVVIGGTLTAGNAAAVNVGQFPAGSVIIIDNAGKIVGKSGVANGGSGGDAIKADYPNQTVIIENRAGGQILAGGGAGGAGGRGGTYYYTCQGGTVTVAQDWRVNAYSCTSYDCNTGCWNYFGSNWYCSSGCVNYGPGCETYCCGGDKEFGCQYSCATGYTSGCNSCSYNTTCSAAGGAGGAGGRGAGYVSSSGALAALGGSAGSNPSNGGGVGGTGGAGGTYGSNGNAGNTGGNSSSGHGGSVGGGGGAAGRAVLKGNHNVTITNAGTIMGATNV